MTEAVEFAKRIAKTMLGEAQQMKSIAKVAKEP